ncbi:MAG TPA: hypothetical protein VJK02_21255 [Anaerolineales bacterium]|nr:hypothetical protein [Anaerolineales bacterium]
MSIMPGVMIDLHEYEHALIRAVLNGQVFPPVSALPASLGYDPSEWLAIIANRAKAQSIYDQFALKNRKEGG